MALGAAFRAANISTAFRVRKVGMTDISPYPMGVRLTEIRRPEEKEEEAEKKEGEDGEGEGEGEKKEETEGAKKEAEKKEEKKVEKKEGEEEKKLWSKRATLFKKNDRLASRKMVTFKHDTDFSCTFLYDAPTMLPEGTPNRVATYVEERQRASK